MKHWVKYVLLIYAIFLCVPVFAAENDFKNKELVMYPKGFGGIGGYIYNSAQYDPAQTVRELMKAAPKNSRELGKIVNDIKKRSSVSVNREKIKVRLQGGSLKRETLTGRDGFYVFDNVPYGKYTITAEIPECPTVTPNVRRTAIAQGAVELSEKENSIRLNLEPRTLLASIEGSVYDSMRKPIAGAKVVAEEHFQKLALGEARLRWETITDSTGHYVLHDFRTEDYVLLARYIAVPKFPRIRGVCITAEYEGYLDSKIIHVVNEEVLSLAEPLAKIQMGLDSAKQYGYTGRQNVRFPSSTGSAITDVNFTLHDSYRVRGKINGKVLVGTEFDLEKLELAIPPQSVNSMQALFDKILMDSPRYRLWMVDTDNIEVILSQQGRIIKKLKLKSSRDFSFNNLTIGWYTVGINIPLHSNSNERFFYSDRAVVDIKQTDLEHNLVLTPRSQLLGVKGRVTDESGRPIANVAVRVYLRPGLLYQKDTYYRMWEGITHINGEYEINNVHAAMIPHLAHYFMKRTDRIPLELMINASATGYRSEKAIIPSVSKNALSAARMHAKLLSAFPENTRYQWDEQRTTSLPKSDGSTITGVDFVLKKAKVGESPQGY